MAVQGGNAAAARSFAMATPGSETVWHPGALQGPLVWSGADLKVDDYALKLGEDDVREVETALWTFKTFGLDGDEVSQHNFLLPTLGPRLEACAEALHQGRGFCLIRGLDASRYSAEDSTIIYLGISSYIGDERGLQDGKGNMLSHIISSKLWTTPSERRHSIHTSASLPFHTDMGCDILALQVRHSAREGGGLYVSSAWTAFNELLLQEPDVVKCLLECDWPVRIRNSRTRRPAHYLGSALALHEGNLMASLEAQRFGPHPQSAHKSAIPTLSAFQQYALARLSEAARRSELRLEPRAGDLVFLNNWAMLHRRDAYRDGGDASRHLVRLWLRNARLGWAVPKAMELPWLASYRAPHKTRMYPLVPMPTYTPPRYSAGSAAFVLEDSSSSESDDSITE